MIKIKNMKITNQKKIKIPNKNWKSINWIIQDNEIIIKKNKLQEITQKCCSKITPGKKSLRFRMPKEIAEEIDLKKGDTIEWKYNGTKYEIYNIKDKTTDSPKTKYNDKIQMRIPKRVAKKLELNNNSWIIWEIIPGTTPHIMIETCDIITPNEVTNTSKVDDNNMVIIPNNIMEIMDLKKGDYIEFEESNKNNEEYRIKKIANTTNYIDSKNLRLGPQINELLGLNDGDIIHFSTINDKIIMETDDGEIFEINKK